MKTTLEDPGSGLSEGKVESGGSAAFPCASSSRKPERRTLRRDQRREEKPWMKAAGGLRPP